MQVQVRVRVRVLGELEIEVDGRPVALGGPKPRVLVGLLAASMGRPVSIEHLIDQIWKTRPHPGSRPRCRPMSLG